MSSSKNIMVVQSRTTGRFLLKENNGVWTWPSVVENDPAQAVVYNALSELMLTMGQQDSDDWLLDYVGMPWHQLFHVWVTGEPQDVIPVGWFHLFDFPEVVDPIVDMVLNQEAMLARAIASDT